MVCAPRYPANPAASIPSHHRRSVPLCSGCCHHTAPCATACTTHGGLLGVPGTLCKKHHKACYQHHQHAGRTHSHTKHVARKEPPASLGVVGRCPAHNSPGFAGGHHHTPRDGCLLPARTHERARPSNKLECQLACKSQRYAGVLTCSA